VAVKDSLGIIVNGEEALPIEPVPEPVSDTPQVPYTGLLKARDNGWTEGDATVTITQRQPLPFHVLALSGILHVGQA